MTGLNFSIKPDVEINEIKKLLIKFKKNKNYKKKILLGIIFLIHLEKQNFL
jgi:hypothetical protein